MKIPLSEILENSFYFPQLISKNKKLISKRDELNDALEKFFGVCENNSFEIIHNLKLITHEISKQKALNLLKETKVTEEDKQNFHNEQI